MTTLREIQESVQLSIIRAKPSGSERFIADLPPIGREERLLIYINAYFSRLAEVLAKDYPKLFEALGDEFDLMVAQYLLAHPSRSHTVSDIGKHLCEFLESTVFSEKLPHLPKLAKLEWLKLKSYFADKGEPIDPERLRRLTESEWESVTFVFHPSVYLFEQNLIYRKDEDVHEETLDPSRMELLRRLFEGKSLGEACSNQEEDIPIGEWLSDWMAKGLFTPKAASRGTRCDPE